MPPAPATRVALVSGVARPPGIGRATALRLVRAGFTVACAELLAARPTDTGAVAPKFFDDVVAEIEQAAGPGSGRVLALPQHESGPRSWQQLVDATTARFGRVDVLCALNGVTGPQAGDGALVDVTEDAWAHGLELNLTATWLLARAAARAMKAAQRPGAIVVLSSQAALLPKAEVGALGAARAAVNHLVAVLAKEVGPDQIRVNAVAPLSVAPSERFPNPGLIAVAERQGISFAEWIARQIPLGRAQDADETAAVIEFLCSDGASFVSGVTIPVHGGAQP